ncbi:type II toxin-antitoxin system Phd/YefM family antitoxin [Aliterella atlantica]|uniref:Antitoxin n=1 Tax=Aliterella atlantica CENA595 TaxID=1618023 RepID=A0A0D8ZSK4_9CYAN|nr:type II toxin-antitoxin system Phd/YefM family antitoxin [Aliterella atlantica]KJH70196.1 hypothetical protein UH38_19575 [Aliterella atlantica CENA595]
MDVLSATKARANLFRLIDETADAHKQVLITGQRNNAVLVSQEDWNAIQETLYLISIPGMAESIIEGGQTTVEECINLEELKLGLADNTDEASS